jgi:hypothetical protein
MIGVVLGLGIAVPGKEAKQENEEGKAEDESQPEGD